MLNITPKFYDKYGNFNNQKFIEFLNKAKRASSLRKEGKRLIKNNETTSFFNIVRKKELWGFINKLSIYINSGIDVKAALTLLVKQVRNYYLGRITLEMKENIDHGITISETMKRYPKVFDTLTTSLIGVGEKTGQLGRILVELDTSLIESIEIRGKVRGAMIYPIFLLIMMIGVIIFLMAFVVPKITDGFLQADIDLPRLTQVVVDISNFVRNDWEFLLAGIIGIYALFKVFGSTYIGKMTYANIIIEVPIFGYIVRQSNIVYFIRSFTLLLDSGVLLLESLKTSSDVVTNLAYRKELVRVKNEVELGLTISKSLGLNTDYSDSIYLNHLFPEDFAYVVNTGEETGSLSVALKRIGDNYNGELKRYIGNLSTMVEPIIIVIVGALVGTIVIAIMLPFFKIGQVVQNL